MAKVGQLGQSPPEPRAPGQCRVVVVVVIQQWEGPRPLGRVGRLGEGELASAPWGQTSSAEAQAEPRAPKTGCRVVVPHPAAALGGGAGRAEDVGLP